MHAWCGRERLRRGLVMADSFNFGHRAGRRERLDPRALGHGLIASGSVLIAWVLLKLI